MQQIRIFMGFQFQSYPCSANAGWKFLLNIYKLMVSQQLLQLSDMKRERRLPKSTLINTKVSVSVSNEVSL